jgi:hypothetical protein
MKWKNITENTMIQVVNIRLTQQAQEQYGITPESLFAVLSNKYTGY